MQIVAARDEAARKEAEVKAAADVVCVCLCPSLSCWHTCLTAPPSLSLECVILPFNPARACVRFLKSTPLPLVCVCVYPSCQRARAEEEEAQRAAVAARAVRT